MGGASSVADSHEKRFEQALQQGLNIVDAYKTVRIPNSEGDSGKRVPKTLQALAIHQLNETLQKNLHNDMENSSHSIRRGNVYSSLRGFQVDSDNADSSGHSFRRQMRNTSVRGIHLDSDNSDAGQHISTVRRNIIAAKLRGYNIDADNVYALNRDNPMGSYRVQPIQEEQTFYSSGNMTDEMLNKTLNLSQVAETLQLYEKSLQPAPSSSETHPIDSKSTDNSISQEQFATIVTGIAPPPMLSKRPTLYVQVSDHHLHKEDDKNTQPNANAEFNPFRSERIQISPRGTIQIGEWKIRENGLMATDNDNGMANNVVTGGRSDLIEIGPLGSGASGCVVEALHIPTMTIVALKMLPVYSYEKRQQLDRELSVLYSNLASMKLIDNKLEQQPALHAFDEYSTSNVTDQSTGIHVLSMYNAFVNPRSGMINLVIEYMDGGSLQDLVNNGGCQDEDILADIAYQSLLGLKFLHDHNNIHRDIKPANILTSSHGIVKIADFGISKALDGNAGNTNSFIGTVCYMSPERITGGSYNFSSDIWSFGLTMLAVAEGRFPLNSVEGDGRGTVKGGYWGLIRAVVDDAPPKPSPQLFSSKFSDFIDKCLQKTADKRATVKQLLKCSFITDWVRRVKKTQDLDMKMLTATIEESSAHLTPQRPKRLSSLSLNSPDTGPGANSSLMSPGASHRGDDRIVFPTIPEDNVVAFDPEMIQIQHFERILEKLVIYAEDEESFELHTGIADGTLPSHTGPNSNTSDLSSVIHDTVMSGVNETGLSNISDPFAIPTLSNLQAESVADDKDLPKCASSMSEFRRRHVCRIPGFEADDDLAKWQNLAYQLHLNINIVLFAARKTLLKFIERQS